MMNFAEWLRNIEMISESKADQKRLKELLSNAVWTDNHGVTGKFDKSVEGSKENKIYINHPVVGQVMITVSRNLKYPPNQIFTSVMRDYKNRVDQLAEIQNKRKTG
jgi:hypothetical protein